RVGLDRARVVAAVELDPQRQLVGEAAIEGDAPALVGAQEPDLPVPVPGAHGQGGDAEKGDEGLAGGRDAAAAGRAAGELGATRVGGGGGGAAANLGRGQPGLRGGGSDEGRALGGAAGRGRVLEPKGEGGDVVAPAGPVRLVDEVAHGVVHRGGIG